MVLLGGSTVISGAEPNRDGLLLPIGRFAILDLRSAKLNGVVISMTGDSAPCIEQSWDSAVLSAFGSFLSSMFLTGTGEDAGLCDPDFAEYGRPGELGILGGKAVVVLGDFDTDETASECAC